MTIGLYLIAPKDRDEDLLGLMCLPSGDEMREVFSRRAASEIIFPPRPISSGSMRRAPGSVSPSRMVIQHDFVRSSFHTLEIRFWYFQGDRWHRLLSLLPLAVRVIGFLTRSKQDNERVRLQRSRPLKGSSQK